MCGYGVVSWRERCRQFYIALASVLARVLATPTKINRTHFEHIIVYAAIGLCRWCVCVCVGIFALSCVC